MEIADWLYGWKELGLRRITDKQKLSSNDEKILKTFLVSDLTGESLGEKEEKILVEFSGFSGASVISGMAVMARRTGPRDRGVRGIPGTVADRGAGKARVSAGFSAGGAGGIRGTRAEGERGKRWPGFRKGANELSWTVLKICMTY
jgi:hypothetical protein